MSNDSLPLVSFVVPNYNGVKFDILEPCIRSLLRIKYPNFEIILVDNASTDGSIEFVRQHFNTKIIRIVRNERNAYTEGLNLGILASKGKYLVFLNNDSTIDPLYADRIVSVLEQNPEIALAQGLLLLEQNPKIIDNAGDFMDIYGNPFTRGRGEVNNGQYNAITDILSASGSAFVIRRNVIDEVGFFSPLYHIGYEDMDLALRVWLRGYRVAFIPDAIVYHKRAVTDESPELRYLVRHHFNKNRLMTMIRNYSLRNLLRAIPVTIFFYILACLFEALIQRDSKLAMKRLTGIYWCFKELRNVLADRRRIQRDVRHLDDDRFLRLMSNTRGSILGFIRTRRKN